MAREGDTDSDDSGDRDLPNCYHGLCMKLITTTLSLARATLGIWCIHLEVLSVQENNMYAEQRFTLFWCTCIVLLTVPFGITAGVKVSRSLILPNASYGDQLQIHSTVCLVAIIGPLLQSVIAGISFTMDGHGVVKFTKGIRVYDKKRGTYRTYHQAGNDADPNIAKTIMIIALAQLILLLLGFAIHVKSFIKKENAEQTPSNQRTLGRETRSFGSEDDSDDDDIRLSLDSARRLHRPQLSATPPPIDQPPEDNVKDPNGTTSTLEAYPPPSYAEIMNVGSVNDSHVGGGGINDIWQRQPQNRPNSRPLLSGESQV